MLEVRINNQNLRPLLEGPPVISDQLNAVCRTLTLTVRKADTLANYLGQTVELWYGGTRWFTGFLRKRGYTSDGAITYTAYDPLYFLKHNPNDWYFKYITATQAIRQMTEKLGIRVASLANTGYALPPLFYQKANADTVAIDLLARTYNANGRRYWYRYKPDAGSDGLLLEERAVPSKIWAFQVGVNLEAATYEESIEETSTIVKLVNRETGKVVTRINTAALNQYGPTTYFEEVDKDQVNNMERQAQDLLNKLSIVNTSMQIEGINPNRVMPQLYSGDAIYVEESTTGLIGGYYIRNITQTFESDNLIKLGIDIQAAPDIPTIQYEDATTDPNADNNKSKSKSTASSNKGVQQEYSAEMKTVIDKYGL